MWGDSLKDFQATGLISSSLEMLQQTVHCGEEQSGNHSKPRQPWIIAHK